MTNLSQWFDLAEQKPWEVGVYEVELRLKSNPTKPIAQISEWFSYFDGYEFKTACCSVNRAEDNSGESEEFDIFVVKWRGLSTNPDLKKKQGNKRVTRYVVMDLSGMDKPSAVFEKLDNALKYSEKLNWPRITKIRFRTSE